MPFVFFITNYGAWTAFTWSNVVAAGIGMMAVQAGFYDLAFASLCIAGVAWVLATVSRDAFFRGDDVLDLEEIDALESDDDADASD